ncbi:hypothetical protein H2248_009217 [Termitomyces sp. 'cryptogamus']|nr:hypothetical protein H2248_009217 [Termitomyces sp. 'cryptogamus']
MDLLISNIPSQVKAKTVRQAVVNFVSSNKNLAPLAYSHLLDIRVDLGHPRKAGKGILAFPTSDAGRQFLSLFVLQGIPLKIRETEIFFSQISNTSRWPLTMVRNTIPLKAPPKKMPNNAHRDLRVLGLQFGVLYRPRGFDPKVSRSFSIEWERQFVDLCDGVAWLGSNRHYYVSGPAIL